MDDYLFLQSRWYKNSDGSYVWPTLQLSPEDIAPCLDILALSGFHPKQDGRGVVLSGPEYAEFEKGRQSRSNLQGDQATYNPLDEYEWQVFYDDIYFDMPDDKQTVLFSYIKEQETQSTFNSYILHEFIKPMGTYSYFETYVGNPIITMSKEGDARLKSINAGGLAEWESAEIVLPTSIVDMYSVNMMETFYHELRHLEQYAYGLSEKRDDSPQTKFVLRQSIEAEAAAVSELNKNLSFKNEALEQFQTQVIESLSIGQEQVQHAPNAPLSEKLANTLRYIRASSEKRYVGLSMAMRLSPNRFEAGRYLERYHIAVRPNVFHSYMCQIESWKKYYFAYHGRYMNEAQNEDLVNLDSHSYNDCWKRAGYNLNVSLQDLFTYEGAQKLGIAKAVYGVEPPTSENNLSYCYSGISDEIVTKMNQAYNDQKFSDVYRMFMDVANQNPIIDVLPHYDRYYRGQCNISDVKSAFDMMVKNEHPYKIITTLQQESDYIKELLNKRGYSLRDATLPSFSQMAQAAAASGR